MQSSRRQWLEFAGAVTLLGLSTGLVLAQSGDPPVVPKCFQCRSPGYCGQQTVWAEVCCCCLSGTGSWSCKAETDLFQCVNPPPGWSDCFRVL